MGDVRQAGLHIGVEFVTDPKTRNPGTELLSAVRRAGFSHGIIFGVGGMARNVLKIKPPLVINRDEADRVLERFEQSLTEGIEEAGGGPCGP
jgi:4-aminobutyrate aminotransferase-like enzyme